MKLSYLPQCSTSYNMNGAICRAAPPRAHTDRPLRHFSPVNTFSSSHIICLSTKMFDKGETFDGKSMFNRLYGRLWRLWSAMSTLQWWHRHNVYLHCNIRRLRGEHWVKYDFFALARKKCLANLGMGRGRGERFNLNTSCHFIFVQFRLFLPSGGTADQDDVSIVIPMGWTVEEKEEEDYKVWAIKRPLDVLDDKWCRGLAHTLTASRYITYNPLASITPSNTYWEQNILPVRGLFRLQK